MKRTNELIVALAVMAVIIVVTWGLYAVGDNMPAGVSPFSKDVYELHNVILAIVTVIGVLVFTAMFTSIILHRKSKNYEPAQFSHSTGAEIAWTAIPVLILVVMAIPATSVLIDMEETGGADINIKVTGYQWLWQYEYLEEDISFYSTLDRESNQARQINSGIDVNTVDNYLLGVDKPLVVPIDTKIRFLLTSVPPSAALREPEPLFLATPGDPDTLARTETHATGFHRWRHPATDREPMEAA